MIKALFKPNIFTKECFEYSLDSLEQSLDEIIKDIVSIDQTGLPKNKDLLYNIANYVEVNNILIPKEKWKDYYLCDGDVVSLVFLPLGSEGGGDKNTLATVLGVVVAVVATVASFGAAAGVTALGGSAILANLAGAATGAAVSIAGGLAIEALFPAEAAADDTQEIKMDAAQYSISGGRNDLNPYGAIPVVLGKIKVTPYYYRPTFTEAQGSLSYLSSGFIWGYADNGLKIENVKIGDTPIEQYKPIIYENTIDTMPSKNDDNYTIQSSVNLELINLDSTEPKGDYIYRTVKNTNTIVVDLAFPQGLYSIAANGAKGEGVCNLRIEYRLVGTDKWLSLAGGIVNIPTTYIGSMSKTRSRSLVGSGGVVGGWFTQYSGQTFYIVLRPVIDEKGVYIRYDAIKTYNYTSNDVLLYEYIISDDKKTLSVVDRRKNKSIFNIMQKNYNKKVYYFGTPPHQDTVRRTLESWDIYLSQGSYELPALKIVDDKTSLISKTFNFPVGNGDYEMRVAKLPNEFTTAQTMINRVVWVSYGATYKEPSFKYKYPLATTYLYLQANEKLNGVVDTLTGICTSIVNDYNYVTKQWEIRASTNPASLILYVLTGNPNAKRLKFNANNDINDNWDSIDKNSFEKFHDYCRINNYEYNRYITEAMSVWELVQQIASTARAFVSLISGKWAVVIDQKQDMIKAMITPYNSWGASTTKNLPNIPHALRVSFFNETNDYVADERIVYNDGYDENNAEDFQAQNIQGITHPDRIYVYAREMLKASKARVESHTVSMDWESLTLSLRDRVWFSYDYLKNAVGYGRIKEIFLNDSAQITGFTADQYFTTDDKTYGVMIRILQKVISVEIEQLNNSNRVMFTSPQSINTGIEEGCIFSIGELNRMGSDCIVSKIERENDFVAKITLIDYAPEIYDEASKPVPPFESNINTVRPSIQRPTEPFGVALSVSYMEGYTGVEYFVNLTWNAPLNSPVKIKEYEAESKVAGLSWEKEGTTKELFLKMSKAPSSYTGFRVRAVGINDTVSDWVELYDFSLEGTQLHPSDITPPINSVFKNGSLYIDWNGVFDLRPVQYEVRMGRSWAQSSLVEITSETEVKAKYDGIYWIKSKVYPDLYCKNAISINVVNSHISTGHLYKEIISEPAWSGEKVNFELVDGELETRAYQGIYTSHEQVMLNTPSKAYIYTQFDIESYSDQDIYKVEDIYAITDIYARKLERDIYSIADIYAVDDIYAKGDDVGYDFQPQIQIFLDGEWGEWKNFTPDNYYGQGFNFRLIITKENEDTLIRLLSFKIKVDVEDRTEIHNNIVVEPSGAEVLFNNPFNEPPAYQVSIVGGEGNETFEIEVFTDKAIIKLLRNGEYISGKVNLLVMGF